MTDTGIPAADVKIASLTKEFQSADATLSILRGIDLELNRGDAVAVTGPSGSGKTTMTSLVPRLYDVTSGAITIDGLDVREVTQDSLRRAIGVVSQDRGARQGG